MVVLLWPGIGFSQGSPGENSLNLYAGVSVFSNPDFDSVALVEVNFSLNRHEFEFFTPDYSDSNLYARIFAQLDLMDATGLGVDSAMTYFSVSVPNRDEADKPDIRLFNKLSIYLKPNIYSARLTVIDVVSKAEGILFFDAIEVLAPAREELSVSDLVMGYRISRVKAEGPGATDRLVKNGLRITPNPNAVYSDKDTTVTVYAEIYNLVFDSLNPGQYLLSFSLLDKEGNNLRTLGTKKVKKPGRSSVISEEFDINGWPAGQYQLEVTVEDLSSSENYARVSSFSIVSKQFLAERKEENLKLLDPYNKLTIRQKIQLLQYVATAPQLETLNRLSESGQENFMVQFWEENDINPATVVIENRLELVDRFAYVNSNYSTNDAGDNGWSTDQGRIYMTYGVWDEREVVSTPRVGNPFEIWHYRMMKEGKYFIFEDWSGTLEYRLVHSNIYGEVFNQFWEDRVHEELLEIY